MTAYSTTGHDQHWIRWPWDRATLRLVTTEQLEEAREIIRQLLGDTKDTDLYIYPHQPRRRRI